LIGPKKLSREGSLRLFAALPELSESDHID